MSYLDDVNMLQAAIRTIVDERKELNKIPAYFQGKWYHELMLNHLSEYRKIPKEAFEKIDVFFINPDESVAEAPEFILDRAHGLVYNEKYWVYGGRYVFPVKDVQGDIMGFVGYIYNEENKYIDSRTFGYVAKRTTMFGMEKLPEYYTSDKCLFITEGIMDMAYLRYHGHNSMSLLTSKIGKYQCEILKRFGRRCIILADNDSSDKFTEERTAGEGFVKQALYLLPEARVFQTIRASDINDVIRLDNGKYERQVLFDLNEMENFLCITKEFRQRTKRTIPYAKQL